MAEVTALSSQVELQKGKDQIDDTKSTETEEADDTSEEDPLPEKWKFEDCVDRPVWAIEIQEALSQLTDFVYPRLQSLARKKGWSTQPFDTNEVTQLLAWICMLTITTKGEFTEIAVEIFRVSLKAWSKGRSARRRSLARCHSLETTLGARPLSDSELSQKMLHLPSIAADNDLMDTVFSSLGLGSTGRAPSPHSKRIEGISYSLWIRPASEESTKKVAIVIEADQFDMDWSAPGYTKVTQKDTENSAWEAAMTITSSEKTPVTVYDPFKICPNKGFWEKKGAQLLAEPLTSIPDNQKSSKDPAGAERMKKDIIDEEDAQTNNEVVATPEITNVGNSEPLSEEEPALDANPSEDPTIMTSAPLFLEEMKRGKRSAVPKNITLSNVLDRAHGLVSFTIGRCQSTAPTGISMSWLVDTGTDVSQISMSAAKRYWEALTPLGHAVIVCKTAHGNNRIDMQFCILKQLSLFDPFSGALTAPSDTIVFINPKVQVDCILGKNSISDFDLRIHLNGLVIWDCRGCELQLLTKSEEKEWRVKGLSKLRDPTKRDLSKERPRRSSPAVEMNINRAAQTPRTPVNVRSSRGSSWSMRRFMRLKEDQVYTPRDKKELREAQQMLMAREEEDRLLQERIANVAIAAGVEELSDESTSVYQPCRRLVRLSEKGADSSIDSMGSIMGAQHDSFYTDASSIDVVQRSPSPETMKGLFDNSRRVTSEQLRKAMGAKGKVTPSANARQVYTQVAESGASVESPTSAILLKRTRNLFDSSIQKPQGKDQPNTESQHPGTPKLSDGKEGNPRKGTDEFPLDQHLTAAVLSSWEALTSPALPLRPVDIPVEPDEECENEETISHALLAHMVPLGQPKRSTLGNSTVKAAEQEMHVLFNPKGSTNPLQRLLEEASSYGSYMPALSNGIAMLWHVDSGANTSQCSPDMLPRFEGTLTHIADGPVKFKSAEATSKTEMSLYEISSFCLLQLESGITSIPCRTRLLCNPVLGKKTLLLGLNTLKDMGVFVRHASDTLIGR